MESCFEESELGLECFIVADKIFRLGNDTEQVLCFGKRALTILTDNFKRTRNVSYLLVADVLRLLGSTCLDLERFDESLCYLNRAEMNLSKVKDEEDKRRVLISALLIQTELRNVKVAMSNREEAIVHSKTILEIKKKVMEEGSVGLGDAYKDVCLAYIKGLDIIGALPFCLKALEIYTKCLGPDSVEVAEVTRHLSVIYAELGEKALELNKVAMTLLKKTNSDSPDDMHLLAAEAEGADTLVDLGRYQEAIDMLKDVVSRDDVEGPLRVKSVITMARALCFLGKFSDAKEYMSRAQRMLEEKEIDPVLAAIGFADISALYQKMNDFETAIPLMKRGLAVPALPQKLLPELCAAIMSLISISGKEKEKVPYMEDEVEKLKESFGPEHCVVGYGYLNLGVAYLKSGQKELGVKSLANAKDILDAILGPHHLTSLKISHSLSVAYAMLGRYHQALEIVEKVCVKV